MSQYSPRPEGVEALALKVKDLERRIEAIRSAPTGVAALEARIVELEMRVTALGG